VLQVIADTLFDADAAFSPLTSAGTRYGFLRPRTSRG